MDIKTRQLGGNYKEIIDTNRIPLPVTISKLTRLSVGYNKELNLTLRKQSQSIMMVIKLLLIKQLSMICKKIHSLQ